jgi:hypothetical protein
MLKKPRHKKARPTARKQMKLWRMILPLHQAINSIMLNYPLVYLSKENIRDIEDFRGKEAERTIIKRRIAEITKIAARCSQSLARNIYEVRDFLSLKEAFSELLMFVKLARRYAIVAVPTADLPTPDSKIRFNSGDIVIEKKSLNVVKTEKNLGRIITKALANKAEMREQIGKLRKTVGRKNRVVMTEQCIQPFWCGQNYDPDSTRDVVNALIEKADQNISESQFAHGPTVLLVDFSDQLTLHDPPNESLEREFFDPVYNCAQSGELWHFAFGEIGMRTKSVPHFEGMKIKDEPLERQGILRKHPFIAGLAVHYEGKFWGAAIRRANNIHVIQFLEDLCEKVKIENA